MNRELVILLLKFAGILAAVMGLIVICCVITPKIARRIEKKLPQDEEAFVYTIQQATFRDMLRKVSYAASQDDTRRTLKGVLLSFKDSKLTMVATDGRRLALVEQEIEFPKDAEKDIILPSKAVGELQRLHAETHQLPVRRLPLALGEVHGLHLLARQTLALKEPVGLCEAKLGFGDKRPGICNRLADFGEICVQLFFGFHVRR